MTPAKDALAATTPDPSRASQGPPRAIDDPLVISGVQQYRATLEEGGRPDRQELIGKYPEVADELAACLDALEFVHQVAPQLREQAEAAPGPGEIRPLAALGDFRIERQLGRGGMGVVYEATQLSLGRRVALKVLPFAAVLDPRHLQRFKNEAQAAASLEHPNIVNIYSVGCERGVHYYAMQYVEGQTLAEVIAGLRQGSGDRGQGPGEADEGRDASSSIINHQSSILPAHPLTPSPAQAAETSPLGALSTEGSIKSPEFFCTVARLGIQAAEALEHAHQMGVVHRDIKPSNLMVESRLPTPSGRRAESNLPSPSGRGVGGEGRGTQAPHLWITDFGLARISPPSPLRGEGRGEGSRGEGGRGDGASLTMTGDILGTLRYMSPEQLEAKHSLLDHRTDIYSLGLTLYELLTLQPAFPGDDRQKLIRQVMEEDPRPPRQVNKAIPTDLETIIMKATANEPQSRYVSAGELADDLRRFVEDQPIQARRPTLAQRAARWSRRHYWLVSRGIAASFALLSITALVIFNAHQREVKQRLRAEQTLATAMDLLDDVYVEYAGEGYLKAAFASSQPEPAEEMTPKTKEFLKQALGLYARFAAFNPDEPSLRWRVLKANIRLGECQSRLGSYQEAERTFKSAISLAEELVAEVQGPSMYQEDLARARAGLADVAARKGNWDQVIVDLTHAIRLNPSNSVDFFSRGYAYAEKRDFEHAIADYTEGIRLDPKNARAYNNRGVAYTKKGDSDRAFADFNEAIRLDGGLALPYANRGVVHAEEGQFDRAIAEYSQAIRLDPKYANAYQDRGHAYCRNGQLDRGIADYDEAIRLGAKFIGYSDRGCAYSEKGQFDRAITDYDEAIRANPNNVIVYANRGESYCEKGEFDRAIADCDRAVQLEPKGFIGYKSRAATRAKMGEIEDALSDVRKALASHVKMPGRKNELAWFLATCEEPRLRRVDRALELANAALKQAPKYAEIWTTLGAAEYRAGHWQAAVEALQKSSELKYYNVARTGFFRAMAHWQLGQKDQARQCYQQAAAWMEKNRPWDKELGRFRAEAEELMGIVETHHGGTEKTGK
jgi:serine/threonine protein kinase/Flp pilus assembly protein TadD